MPTHQINQVYWIIWLLVPSPRNMLVGPHQHQRLGIDRSRLRVIDIEHC